MAVFLFIGGIAIIAGPFTSPETVAHLAELHGQTVDNMTYILVIVGGLAVALAWFLNVFSVDNAAVAVLLWQVVAVYDHNWSVAAYIADTEDFKGTVILSVVTLVIWAWFAPTAEQKEQRRKQKGAGT